MSEDSQNHPFNKRRMRYAFLVAPLHVLLLCAFIVLIISSFAESWSGNFILELVEKFSIAGFVLFYGIIVTYTLLLLLALPLLIFIKSRVQLTKTACVLSGAGIGGIPIGLALLIGLILSPEIINHVSIFEAILRSILTALIPSMIGAAIGWRFWYILTRQ